MEFFDILNEDGSKSGIKKERNAVHKDGDLHASVHIWIIRRFDGVKKVLLQRRSMDKDSYPGCLDASCTGHIDAGEEIGTAAVRELSEELNIKADFSDFIFITQFHVNERNVFHNDEVFINNEINNVFILSDKISVDELKAQESEIDELLWADCESVRSELENNFPENKYCIDLNEFNTVMKFYEDNIKDE